MAIIGVILGDIAGSQYEFNRPYNMDHITCPLFNKHSGFTDDTVLTLATKYVLDNDVEFKTAYHMFGNRYPQAGYGDKFSMWLHSRYPEPYNSYGNGSAMRCSYIGEYFKKETEVIEYACRSAECTHNHSEGIKGAITTAMWVYMAKHGASKKEILSYASYQYAKTDYKYSPEVSLDTYRNTYRFNETCQATVPVAIRCFLESEDYETFIRTALSLDGDVDTLCAIGGGIAEEYYKKTGFNNKKLLKRYLDPFLYKMVGVEKFKLFK